MTQVVTDRARKLLDDKGQGNGLPRLIKILREGLGLNNKVAAEIANRWMKYKL